MASTATQKNRNLAIETALGAVDPNVQFASVSGDFNGTVNTFGPIAQTIDIPLGFDAITLTNAILTVNIANGVNLPGSSPGQHTARARIAAP